VKEGDCLAKAGCTGQGKVFDIRLAIAVMGRALFEGSFKPVYRMQVENVGDRGVIGCIVLHFKPSALVWWSAENSQVSVAKFQKRESTDIHQSQGLFILANFGQPKCTVGASVILQVFNGLMLQVQENIQLVIYSLTRIIDIHAKVRGVVVLSIFAVFNYVEALYWTYDGHPSRRFICFSAAH